MTVKMILCQNQAGYIGLNNELLYRLPKDLAYFKEVTMGKPVLMGRKTWDSIPAKFRPLPGRKNIVISNTMDKVEGVEVKRDLLTLLDHYSKVEEELFVIGGGMIYEAAMPYVSEIHMTLVYDEKEGDVEAPCIDIADWELHSGSALMTEGNIRFRFNVYRRKK